MHAISPYIFKVLDEDDVLQDLWNINGKSFVEYLKENYFRHIYGVSRISRDATPTEVGKNYILDQVYESTEHSICGRFSTGEFGFEADIFDNQRNIYSGKREAHESMMLPFYFGFYTPKTDNELDQRIGVLLLSRFNKYGIRSIVVPHLVTHFESSHKGLFLKVEKIVPTSFVNSVIKNSSVKKIKFSTAKLPETLRGVLTAEDFDNFYEMETVIKPKPRSFFSKPSWLSELAAGVPINTLITIPDTEITKLKVEIHRGKGRSRTIDVSDVNRMVANIEIDNPELTARKHISPDCWFREADLLADDYFLELGLSIEKWDNLISPLAYNRGVVDVAPVQKVMDNDDVNEELSTA